jgi:hypothetical protein
VTLPDVLHAAERHLHPTAMQTVIVGDPAVVAEPLGEAGFGKVESVEE